VSSQIPESLIGKKVSIYCRTPADPQYPFSEVLGVVQREERDADGNRTLFVVKRDAILVEVAEKDVVSLKVVPPSTGPLRIPDSWSGYREGS
jgi:hypothetical protein